MDYEANNSTYSKCVKSEFLNSIKWTAILFPVIMLAILSIYLFSNYRSIKSEEVKSEISSKWGGSQSITGAVLIFESEKNIKLIYPNSLSVNAKLFPEIRYRGIYHSVVYNAKVEIQSIFPDIVDNNATFYIGFSLSDSKAIDSISAKVGNENLEFYFNEKLRYFTARIDKSNLSKNVDVKLLISMRGSEQFLIDPIGKKNLIDISSEWNSPSFVGDMLPSTRKITNDSFNAQWDVSYLATHYPNEAFNNHSQKKELGVAIHLPVNAYTQIERTITYSFLFVAIFIFTYLISERFSHVKSHIVQYFAASGAIVMFYLLLLSISEHLGFDSGFALSASISTILLSTYFGAVFRSPKIGLCMLGLFSISYSLMFILLQSENFALLIGSFILLIMLSIFMALTAKINNNKS